MPQRSAFTAHFRFDGVFFIVRRWNWNKRLEIEQEDIGQEDSEGSLQARGWRTELPCQEPLAGSDISESTGAYSVFVFQSHAHVGLWIPGFLQFLST